jgi:integrase
LDRQTITLTDTKNKERRVVPLVGRAHELVSNLPRVSERLFPGKSIKYAWYRAVRESGIQDFRFHDLRHTAASYMAMNGVPLLTIAAILGHKDLSMTRRYAHLSVDHLRGGLGNLNDMMFPDV